MSRERNQDVNPLDTGLFLSHGSGTSFCTPVVAERLAKWMGNFPISERPEALRYIRSFVMQRQATDVTTNFDALFATHRGSFPDQLNSPLADSKPPAVAE
jgi:hypothetical protein